MRKHCVLVLLLLLLTGCASTRDTAVVDPPWSAEDQAALERLSAAARVDRSGLESVEPAGLEAFASPTSLLEVYVFNIGQGDSMLVVGPPPGRKTLLVDLGEPTPKSKLPANLGSSADHVRKRIRAITGKSRVDYFVLSHYHSDHAGRRTTGIIGLLSDFDTPFHVGEFIHVQNDGAQFMKQGANDRSVHRFIREAMSDWKTGGRVGTSSQPRFGTTQIDLGSGVEVDILAFAGKVPSGESAFQAAIDDGADYDENPGNENDLSIALQIRAGEFELWTAGDLNGTDNPTKNPFFILREFGEIYTNIEHHLVSHWESTNRESDVEVFRANHHGSGYSNTKRLLDTLDPEVILYSTGADHGHPTATAVKRGGKTATQFATTAVISPTTFSNNNGSIAGEIRIVVANDGQSYKLNGKTHTAFTDEEEANGADEEE